MHAMGVHSALAIKRQRKRRDEQRRARERRYSVQSTESGLTSPGHSPRGSFGGTRRRTTLTGNVDSQVVTSVGMLHIGVVFLVLGLFLIGAGLLPDDITRWGRIGADGWWNELVCTGLFAAAIGIFLIILNRFLSRREEEELENYVERQLTRSRSGHRLEMDVETGCLTTRHHRRALQLQRDGIDRGLDSPEPPMPSSPPPVMNGGQENTLEKILEEESSVYEEGIRMQGFTTVTVSPVLSPSDTKYLLGNGHPMGISRI